MKLSLGGMVAADVELTGGEVLLDQSMLTGESVPTAAGPGLQTYAGALVRRGEAEAEVVAAAPICRRVIRIAITLAAYAAIAATLPGNIGIERERAQNGDVYIWLDPGVVAKLKAVHVPGESYSDAIVRLARG